jgi:membrane protease YdiL (CAAX protease family)
VRFGTRELHFTLTATAVSVALGIAFVRIVAVATGRSVRQSRDVGRVGWWTTLLTVAVLLLAVSTQEEVLYRGYVAANLEMATQSWVLVISTLIFTLIHFPTNRVGPAQVVSWIVGGLLLASVYLVSGSIWTAIAIHFGTDFMNVVLFDVIGRGSIFTFDTPITVGHRTVFRVVQAVTTIALLFTFY